MRSTAMSVSIKLSDNIVNEARRYASVYSRSLPKQIEYWSRIGKIAEENPDLPYSFLKEILLALEESKEGDIDEYQFGAQD